MLRSLLLVASLLIVTSGEQRCTKDNCVPPACYCRSQEMPIRMKGINSKNDYPQFVMLTFDDAVSAVNMEFYRELLSTTRQNPNKCPIRATFFVSHEYTNYAFVNELYLKGSEIASHSITHTSNTDEWRNKNEEGWRKEMVGLRRIAEIYGLIPKRKIVGTRAPFLQTSGDETFKMLQKNFVYDSSMPTRKYTHGPMWPYTLTHGFDQDCIVEPCPTGNFSELWEVPLVNFYKLREITPGAPLEEYPCSMADACIPFPETAAETEEYFMNNFKRHYDDYKAPFPLFLHEAWLKDPFRRKGYLNFVDRLLKIKDVYFVTVHQVIEYMKKPIPLAEYSKQKCPDVEGGTGCKPRTCNFPKRPGEWNERIMVSCVECPAVFPWVNNFPE